MKWPFGCGEAWEPGQPALGNDVGVRFVSAMVIEQWVVNDLKSTGGRGPFNGVEYCNTNLANMLISRAALSSHTSSSGHVDSTLYCDP